MSDENLVENPETAFYGTRWFAILLLILMRAPAINPSFYAV